MRLDDFDFDLPRELIADRPAEPRDAARLLVLPAAGGLLDRRIADLPELLRPGDLLVFNDTKVIPARLVGRRGQATVEITLAHDGGRRRLARLRQGSAAAAARRSSRLRRRFRGRDRREKLRGRGDAALRPRGRGVPRGAGALRRDAAAALHQAPARRRRARPRPITRRCSPAPRAPSRRRPPGCISRRPCSTGSRRAASNGSTVTLHVGPGTFLPVKTDDPREHRMHAECGIDRRRDGRPHQRGARRAAGASSRSARPACASWKAPPPRAARSAHSDGETRLFILPGYRFRAIDVLLTNFHLPRSTLLMLVAALAGLDRDQSGLRPRRRRALPLLLLRRRLPDRAPAARRRKSPSGASAGALGDPAAAGHNLPRIREICSGAGLIQLT